MSLDSLFGPGGLLDYTSITFWTIAGIALCLVAIAIIVSRLMKGKKEHFSPMGRVTIPAAIVQMLEEAIDQRRDFEIQISTSSADNRPTLKSVPQKIDKTSITLEVIGLRQLSNHWIGREITIFFRITTKGVFSYHTFISSIQAIQAPRKDVCHLVLPLPACIEQRQQRSFLRIEPPADFVYGGAMWYGETLPDPRQMSDVSQWAPPSIFLLPAYAVQFHISDLSAGGLRLRIPNSVVQHLHLPISNVERFIVMLDLLDAEEMKISRFWLQCRSQRITMEPPDQDVLVGAKFMAWAKPRDPFDPGAPGALEWFRLSPSNEVEPVGNWIMRRHLALFRLASDAEERATRKAPA